MKNKYPIIVCAIGSFIIIINCFVQVFNVGFSLFSIKFIIAVFNLFSVILFYLGKRIIGLVFYNLFYCFYILLCLYLRNYEIINFIVLLVLDIYLIYVCKHSSRK